MPATLTVHQLSAADLDEAVEKGVLLAGLSCRFAHPLYRAAAYADVRPGVRRGISATLAELNRDLDAEPYAWHLDAAGADPAVAADAFEAAARVRQRFGSGCGKSGALTICRVRYVEVRRSARAVVE